MKSGCYEDIINLPHPISFRHPPMSLSKRAARFAPFAALSGYDEAIKKSSLNDSSDESFYDALLYDEIYYDFYPSI